MWFLIIPIVVCMGAFIFGYNIMGTDFITLFPILFAAEIGLGLFLYKIGEWIENMGNKLLKNNEVGKMVKVYDIRNDFLGCVDFFLDMVDNKYKNEV